MPGSRQTIQKTYDSNDLVPLNLTSDQLRTPDSELIGKSVVEL